MLTREKAFELKYCDHCAACSKGVQTCGILLAAADKHLCSLPPDVQERFRKEFALERAPIRRPKH